MIEQTLLLIEDNPGDARLFQEMLSEVRSQYRITWVQTLAQALKEITQKKCHLVLSDLGLPDSQGLETVYAVIAAASDMPIIILTGQDDNRIALEAIKAGVQDYLVKNTITPELVGRSIRYAIERKRVEKALRSREDLLEKMFEILPIGLRITDKNGALLKANAAWVKIWGAEPLVGQQGYGEFKGLTIAGEELEIDAFDGRKKTILNYTAPVLDVNGQVEAAIVANVDITGRKQADEELARLSRAIEQSPVAVMRTDLDGNIEYVNTRFTQITGYTLEDVKGRNPRILKSGETSPEEYQKLWETITSGRVWCGEFHNRRKDGALFWERASISPVRNAKGTITHYLAIKEDITAEKSLEMQLHQAQKMESVGRLAGGVAHDFNNMLNVILGFTEIAATQLPKDHPAHPDLEEVKSAALRSAEIIRQLLAFARKQTVSPVVINLNEAVSGMMKMLRRLIGEDIDLSWIPGDDLWHVKLDPSQIDQLLANFMVNARDAIAGVGKITIETENVVFDQSYCITHPGCIPGRYVMLSVTDNGCGMDSQTLARIFEPFFTTKARGVGTGLGLATVYGIVKQNKGFIDVYSEPGYGTTFKIYLPETLEAIETEISNHDLLPRHGTETILLVEDEQSVLNLGREILERLGYTVISAITPSEALALAEHHQGPIHLLITDVVMPEMNGKDLKDHLIVFRPDIRVLYMSGYTSDAIAHHGVLEKGIHFLQKPFSVKTLAARAREALEIPTAD
jgi:PAS domain S-box-containing protein